ncbi:GNAT family N-acetyltransferase [Lentzea chajnantorensis]
MFEATRDPDLWTWLPSRPRTVDEMRQWVTDAVLTREPYAQVENGTGRVVGTTSFYEVVPEHRRLVIGYTVVGTDRHGTEITPEAELLVLTEAFETRRAVRVAWYTDAGDVRSQRAVEELGAEREGVLRGHITRPDGTCRDTVVHSVLADEWPAVRERLTNRVWRGPSR